MGDDKREYRLARRRNTKTIKGNTKDAIFATFFPNIRQKMLTDDLIDEQTRMLNQNKYKPFGV